MSLANHTCAWLGAIAITIDMGEAQEKQGIYFKLSTKFVEDKTSLILAENYYLN